jgi:hypothetical protein
VAWCCAKVVGMTTRVNVLDLRPTQFAVGMLEVDHKIDELQKLKKKDFARYFKETVVPVVRSPSNELYVLDHHHFLFVCYHLGIRKVRVQVKKDLSKSKLTYRAFWKWMYHRRNAYPYCQFGEGPREAIYLPRDIRGVADDPYRSLAWFVRKAGAFKNSDKNFAEFRWANFFRSKKLLARNGLADFPLAMEKAAHLAQSPDAKRLPGYGKLNLAEKQEVKKKLRKKGLKILEQDRATDELPI